MPVDYMILTVIAVLAIGTGLYLLHAAKNCRNRQRNDKHH